MSTPRHVKIHGYVSEIDGDRWWAVLRTDNGDLIAEMTEPRPPDRTVGCLFTVHRTKRGRVYLHWPQGSMFTKNRLKQARIRARVRVAILRESMEQRPA